MSRTSSLPVALGLLTCIIAISPVVAADSGSTDVTATVPQAVMQNTTPIPNGQAMTGMKSDTPVPTNQAPVVTSLPGATEAQFAGDPNEVICRDKEGVTGTLFKAKVCHTRREWAEAQDTAHTMMNRFHHYCGGDVQCAGPPGQKVVPSSR